MLINVLHDYKCSTKSASRVRPLLNRSRSIARCVFRRAGVRSQLESATLKNQRLMEVFKRTTADFRKMCYKLLGYRVDLLASSCYELHSAYAASDRDSLLFQVSVCLPPPRAARGEWGVHRPRRPRSRPRTTSGRSLQAQVPVSVSTPQPRGPLH